MAEHRQSRSGKHAKLFVCFSMPRHLSCDAPSVILVRRADSKHARSQLSSRLHSQLLS
jgi:hypothetical protein